MEEIARMPGTDALYDSLEEALAGRAEQIYDFEILPQGFGPLLKDGKHLGITKHALMHAFLKAREIFFDPANEIIFRQEETKEKISQSISKNAEIKFKVASEIILLFDSEHLTACNWRKRRICNLRHTGLKRDFETALKEELAFTTTLLRSPLHRHSKSPTLWHHRYWTMVEILSSGTPNTPLSAGTASEILSYQPYIDNFIINRLDLLQLELATVLTAGEHHPMNYYAFSYLRQVLMLLASDPIRLSDPGDTEVLRNITNPAAKHSTGLYSWASSHVARNLLQQMHQWCLAQIRDISGWTFLFFLLEIVDDVTTWTAILERTVIYAIGIGWEGEALWAFVLLSISNPQLKLSVTSGENGGKQNTSTCGDVTHPSEIPHSREDLIAWAKTRWGGRLNSYHSSTSSSD